MSYFTYILYSRSLDRFYIGSCKDVDQRVKKHLSNHAGFTGKAKDWTLRLAEEYNEKTVALKRERTLKNWKSKERIWQLIDRCHRDLYNYCGHSMEPLFSSVG
jgi:putative endonuclease